MDFPFAREAISKLFSKSSCNMYPAVPSEAVQNYRGRIAYRADKCIGCGMCERVCAGGAITTSSCTFCATCADFCSRHAITLTRDYHMIATKEEDLLVSGSFIKAPPKKPAAPASEKSAEASNVKPRGDGKPACDESRCVHCTLCAKKCPADALTVDRAAKTWTLDEDKCIGCGTCAEACPKNAIVI